MHIEIILLDVFVKWLARSYGAAMKVHEKPRGDEFARGMIAGRFVIIRRPEGAMEEAEMLEVSCSDSGWLELAEKSWGMYLFNIIKEEENPMVEESRIESLLVEYCEIKADQSALTEREKLVVAALADSCPPDAVKTELTGSTMKAVVTRRFSVSYPAPRESVHPLRDLMAEFPALSEYVRVQYSESGKRLGDLVGRLNDSVDPVPRELHDMTVAVAAIRIVKEGKPGVSVEPIVEVPGDDS